MTCSSMYIDRDSNVEATSPVMCPVVIGVSGEEQVGAPFLGPVPGHGRTGKQWTPCLEGLQGRRLADLDL